MKGESTYDIYDLWNIHKDYMEGTEFDLSGGLAAGPFGSPNRVVAGQHEKEVGGHWERGIDIVRTSYLVLLEAKKDLTVLWFG